MKNSFIKFLMQTSVNYEYIVDVSHLFSEKKNKKHLFLCITSEYENTYNKINKPELMNILGRHFVQFICMCS